MCANAINNGLGTNRGKINKSSKSSKSNQNTHNIQNEDNTQNGLNGHNNPSYKNFGENENTDTGYRVTHRVEDNNSSIDNDEPNTLIQVLHSYEDFQKKNMNYGKVNPYRKRESQLMKMRKSLVKLFTMSNINLDENNNGKSVNSNNSSNNNKKSQGTNFLTSRAAMWNEVEKHDNPDYDLKLESSKNKSYIDAITNNLSILINDTLNDKRGMTYIATVMIILSVLITFISGFITLFNNTSEKNNFNLNTSKNNYDDINQFMNYIKMGNEDSNRNDLSRLHELLEDFKIRMNENVNKYLINKKENNALYELNTNLENKLKELEKKLLVNTKDIDYFKMNSKKEVENIKKLLQENYESFQSKLKDYLKTTDAIKKDIHKKNSIINDIEKKMNKNQIDIKKDMSARVENEKRNLLNTINELQQKIHFMESKLNFRDTPPLHSLLDFSKESSNKNGIDDGASTSDAKINGKNEGSTKKKNDEQTGNVNITKQKDAMWNAEHSSIIQDIKNELEILKKSTKKSTDIILDDVFPLLEDKILKNVENKTKYYLEMYKKDIINEITESKVIYNEEKYKNIALKQEKIQSELLKTINSQVKTQTKIMKDDLNKYLHTLVEQKQIKNDNMDAVKTVKGNYDSLEILQKKVDELYNEFILDYNEIDWALESLGARIVYKMTSSPLNRNDFIEKFLNQIASFLPSEEIYGMIKPMGKDPSIILKPSNFPGDCFSFNGNKGKITIHLPATIDVSSISIQHVHENISNNSNATPKYFSVYGVVDLNWPENFESQDINFDDFKNSALYSCLHSVYGNLQSRDILEKWLKNNKNPNLIHLGDFYFDRKKRISTYPTRHCFPVKRIIFEFTENYGAPYTCVYRLKVHGKKCTRKYK
ncbi:hypothetical protein, conserved [Plasmodium gonderi]|uniref:SUN domain-containing protein n=1 Tax=Plasmodium gonderi TaxID=77519 RepID=A0A1Y1JSY3_PLAGO|nr:hypothetical protein, conserved [Plasmodium gonderi]GAW83533.1 hypothetical protein, conserved [Plasmodium gonderi]